MAKANTFSDDILVHGLKAMAIEGNIPGDTVHEKRYVHRLAHPREGVFVLALLLGLLNDPFTHCAVAQPPHGAQNTWVEKW